MDKSENTLLRTVAFLVSTAISVATFALLSSWAWTQLNPTQQEAIAATNVPLVSDWITRASAVPVTGAAEGEKAPDYRTVTTRVAHTRERR